MMHPRPGMGLADREGGKQGRPENMEFGLQRRSENILKRAVHSNGEEGA